jgi:hypothetical protein
MNRLVQSNNQPSCFINLLLFHLNVITRSILLAVCGVRPHSDFIASNSLVPPQTNKDSWYRSWRFPHRHRGQQMPFGLILVSYNLISRHSTDVCYRSFYLGLFFADSRRAAATSGRRRQKKKKKNYSILFSFLRLSYRFFWPFPSIIHYIPSCLAALFADVWW